MALYPLPEDIRAVEWLPPWTPTTDTLEGELRREVGRGHPLDGRVAIAVARRLDTDDVLFFLPIGPGRVASVSLTWAPERERDPRFPWTTIYESIEEWIEGEMRVDHAELQERLKSTDYPSP